MSRRGSDTDVTPGNQESGREEHAGPRPKELEAQIRMLDLMIEAAWRSSFNSFVICGPASQVQAPSLIDEVIDIHCTPMGVDTDLPPAGWDALARDWERVGSYVRTVMPYFAK